jgi:SAM-dependent methyltransferase
MFSKLIKATKLFSNPRLCIKLLSMNYSGYLKEIGWIESFKMKMPVDKDLKPIPWMTYPFIDFISDRLRPDMEIFEYGSGNSTLWFADRVKRVDAIEHDEKWYKIMKQRIPNNVNLYFIKLDYDGEYSRFPLNLNKKYDIIIIDGRDRVNCIKISIKCLKPEGVIVLDDSERPQYLEGIRFLLNEGFRKIDFWGISPGVFYKKCTTIFYTENNCLGI